MSTSIKDPTKTVQVNITKSNTWIGIGIILAILTLGLVVLCTYTHFDYTFFSMFQMPKLSPLLGFFKRPTLILSYVPVSTKHFLR